MLNIKKIRALANVRRFNFEHCIRYQSVAEHSLFVAMIAREIAKLVPCMCNPFDERDVLEYSIFHDAEEAVTGDFPFLVKRYIRDQVEMLEEKARVELGLDPVGQRPSVNHVVKLADIVELKLYLEEERKMGNTTLFNIEEESWGLIQNHFLTVEYPGVKLWIENNLESVNQRPVSKELKH